MWFLSWTAEQWTVDQQQATAGRRKYSCFRKTPGPLKSCEQGEWVGSNAIRSLAGVFTNNPYIIWLNCQSSTKNVAEISLNPLCLELFTCMALLKTNPEYNWHDNNNCVPHTCLQIQSLFLEFVISALLTMYHTNNHSPPLPWPPALSIKWNSLPAQDTCIPNFRTQSWDNRPNPAQIECSD